MISKSNSDKFYRFRVSFVSRRISVAPLNNDQILSEDREKLFKGEFPNGRLEIFFQVGGTELCDVIIAGAPGFYLFSDRIINTLRENNITGWDAYPVVIRTKDIGELNNYYAFSVLGRADKADRDMAEEVEVELPNTSKKIKGKGYFFPLDSWDGTDIFFHEGTLAAITVTERVKLLLESINTTNVMFKKLSEYIWPK